MTYRFHFLQNEKFNLKAVDSYLYTQDNFNHKNPQMIYGDCFYNKKEKLGYLGGVIIDAVDNTITAEFFVSLNRFKHVRGSKVYFLQTRLLKAAIDLVDILHLEKAEIITHNQYKSLVFYTKNNTHQAISFKHVAQCDNPANKLIKYIKNQLKRQV